MEADPTRKSRQNVPVHPLNETQRGFWTAWRLFPDRPIESACKNYEWLTDLDVGAFRAALQDLVQVTDTLRLQFVEIDGAPFQFARPDCEVGLEFRDFSRHREPIAEAVAWLCEHAQRPFDLAEKAFATALVKCGDRHWIWQFNKHHIISDFTSDGLLIGRLAELYEKRVAQDGSVTGTYPSFLEYLAENPEPETVREEAHTPAPARMLPTLPRARNPLTASTRMIRREIHLGQARLDRLRNELGLHSQNSEKRLHPRLLDKCLSATALLMYRLSGETRISVGLPSHNRFREGSERIIGPLIKTHVLSLDLGEQWTGSDLLREMSAKRHSVLRAARKGSMERTGTFNAVLNFITHTMPDFNGVRSRELTETRIAEKVGLDLVVTVRAAHTRGDIKILFDFNEDVAGAVDPDMPGEVFLRCFDAFSEYPERRLAEIPLCSSDDIDELRMISRIAAETPPPPYLSIPQGFVDQARRTPGATAVFEGNVSLTYAELEARSRLVAQGLIARGVGKNEIVAIRLPRSIDLVVCMLGVMRAGATIFALDEDVPEARAAAILEDTGAVFLIVGDSETLPANYPDLERAGPGELDRMDLATHILLPDIDPDGIMYVIYTSGSSGRPKGIRIPHVSFSRFCQWMVRTVSGGKPVSWALATTLSFESAYRYVLALVSGGAVGTYHARDGLTGMSLVDAFLDDAVDGVSVTPSQLSLLAERQWDIARIRTIIVIGEVLTVELARRARSSFGPKVDIQNWYGPTETVMATTMHSFDRDSDTGFSVPIGRPADGSTVLVLDEGLNPLPRGLIGELCIGGVRMSHGYVNLPERTAKSFVPDPFRENGLIYLTGDLGRVDGNGDLVVHGRKDDQVKVNGVRTELAEVELAVQRHADVERCVVVQPDTATSVLVAFYVAKRDIDEREMADAAGQILMRAMVPSAFVRIDAVPLTQSGKANRKALADLVPERNSKKASWSPSAKEEPGGAVERKLAGIWSTVLGLETIGRRDDFFELGGNSLDFVRMILRAEKVFGIVLPARALGRSTTLDGVATAIQARQKQSVTPQKGPETESARFGKDGGGGENGHTGSGAVGQLLSLFKRPGKSRDHVGGSADELARRLRHMVQPWPGEQVGRKVPVLALNRDGTRPPLFWCFNGAREPQAMAAELGSAQPVFAMRSLQAVTTRKEKNRYLNTFARRYSDEIARIHPGGPYLIGGNCQAGRIAEGIARELMMRGLPVARLLLLDYAPTTPYPGCVSLFFGADSPRHNPFFLSPEPERAWKRLFTDVTWDIVPGTHAQYFNDANAGPFCKRLAHHLEEAIRSPSVRMPPHDRVVGLKLANVHVTAREAEPLTIEVDVLNAGVGNWRPGFESGIAIVARWLDPDGSEVKPYSAHCDLDRLLTAGATWSASFTVIAPKEPGRHRLQIDLVEQGIGKIPSADGKTLILGVEI